MLDSFQYAYKHLIRKKMQMMLTVGGIAIGVYSVMVIASIGMTGQAVIDKELQHLGFDCITVSASDKELSKLDDEAIAAVRNMDEVELAAPLITDFAQVVMREYIGNAVACGIDENAGGIMEITLKNGRMLRQSDISTAAQVCLVDDTLAQAYYKRDNIVGKTLSITIKGVEQQLEIVGVVSSDQSTIKNLAGDYVPAFVYIPYTVHLSISNEATVDQVFIRVKPDKNTITAGGAITQRLSLLAGYRNLYHFDDLAVQKERINSIVQSVTWILTAIGAVSLVVSGLSIMTIMIVSVHDRTREIGIKKAIGAKKSNILVEFLVESLLMALAGSLLGTLACLLTALIVNTTLGIAFIINPGLIVCVNLFSSVVGVIFGVYPAKLAAHLRPVDALRYE